MKQSSSTEHERADSALVPISTEAAFLRAILASADDFVAYLALDGTIRYVNRTLPDHEQGVIGAHWLDFQAPEDRSALGGEFERVVATGKPVTHEARGPAANGRRAWYSRRFAPVLEDGRVVAVVLISRDISEAKQAEAARLVSDRMASVGMLAAGVAHELNNPLSSVIANLDLALDQSKALAQHTPVPAELLDELSDARHAAHRVRNIVRDLRIFSRGDGSAPTTLEVDRVLESTLRVAWNELRHRARLIKEYGRVPAVCGNESQLAQVFLNLLVNAAQAIPEGDAARHLIRVTTSAPDVGGVLVTIADSGVGMSLEVQKQLFTPFFTTKPAGGGTGLGLAICQRIVSEMGGRIAFESELGKGSVFSVYLPAASAVEHAPPGAPAVQQRRGRVLVVDDDQTIGAVVRRILGAAHDVELADCGARVLELVRQGQRFDVILCDLMMPQMNGMDLYAALAALDPAHAERVVFMTGGAFTTRMQEFLAEVAHARIEKPFEPRALRTLVNDAIARLPR